MSKHSVPHGEKSTAGNANASPSNTNNPPAHQRPDQDAPRDGSSVTPLLSRLRIGGWVKGK